MNYVVEGGDSLTPDGFARLMQDHQLFSKDEQEKITEEFTKADIDQDGNLSLLEFFEYFQKDHYG
jgi:Ca2+-binding EF-hand superfamily protein